MKDVLAMLKEVKEAVSTGQVVDQCSAEKKVEDPADELREMAESRAKASQAENSAADAWMAEFKEFGESRENSSGAESMLTCSGLMLHRLSQNTQDRALALNGKGKEQRERGG